MLTPKQCSHSSSIIDWYRLKHETTLLSDITVFKIFLDQKFHPSLTCQVVMQVQLGPLLDYAYMEATKI